MKQKYPSMFIKDPDEHCFMMQELTWNFHQQPAEVAYLMVEHQHQHMWIGDSVILRMTTPVSSSGEVLMMLLVWVTTTFQLQQKKEQFD
jgi:hypothetical protein